MVTMTVGVHSNNLKIQKVKENIFLFKYCIMSYHYKDYNLMVDRNLFTAAKCGDIALVRDLLTAGYKPNHRDKYGKTALHHATEGTVRKSNLTIRAIDYSR